MTIPTLNKDVVRIIAENLLDFYYVYDNKNKVVIQVCEEPDLIDHVILSWFDPTYEHPELLGLYYPGKVIKHKKPTLVDAARRGNMPLMKELRYNEKGPSIEKKMDGTIRIHSPGMKHEVMAAAIAFGRIDHVAWLRTLHLNVDGCDIPPLPYPIDHGDHKSWGSGGRFHKEMIEWIFENHYEPDVDDAIKWGNLPLAKKLMSEGHTSNRIDNYWDYNYFEGAISYGKTDVLDMLHADYHDQFPLQDILADLMCDVPEGYEGTYSKTGLDWLLANGAVLHDYHYDYVFERVDFLVRHSGTIVCDELQRRSTKGRDVVYAMKWLYENGCPISEEHKDHHLVKMLEKYCTRPQ